MGAETSQKVLDELVDLAAEVITLISKLQLPRSVVDQLTRSISSIGANFAEAQDASSKKDFVNKIYVAKKEANESIYWLKLATKLDGPNVDLNSLQDKTRGYLMMLQKIINSTRDKN